jgi:hypothetical protein
VGILLAEKALLKSHYVKRYVFLEIEFNLNTAVTNSENRAIKEHRIAAL